MELTAILLVCVVVAIAAFAYFTHKSGLGDADDATDVITATEPKYTELTGDLWASDAMTCAGDTLLDGTCIIGEPAAIKYCNANTQCLGYLRPSSEVREKYWSDTIQKDAVRLISAEPSKNESWVGTTYFKKPAKV